jgi:uncharacterized protein YciI
MMDTQEYMYTIKPTRLEMLTSGPTEVESQIVSQHFEYLKRLCEEGIVILAGRTLNTDPSTFGIVIFKAQDEQEAQKVVDADPAVENGVMDAKLYPYRVALLSGK